MQSVVHIDTRTDTVRIYYIYIIPTENSPDGGHDTQTKGRGRENNLEHEQLVALIVLFDIHKVLGIVNIFVQRTNLIEDEIYLHEVRFQEHFDFVDQTLFHVTLDGRPRPRRPALRRTTSKR